MDKKEIENTQALQEDLLKEIANDNGFLIKVRAFAVDEDGDLLDKDTYNKAFLGNFRTLKDLNRKIKDFSNGNLKAHNYADLINHLLDFKEWAEESEGL